MSSNRHQPAAPRLLGFVAGLIDAGEGGDRIGIGLPISRAREIYARAAKLKSLKVTGVDMHIGSQITELDPFGNAFALLAEFVGLLRSDGHTISHIDLGGGLGIPYRDDNEPPRRHVTE